MHGPQDHSVGEAHDLTIAATTITAGVSHVDAGGSAAAGTARGVSASTPITVASRASSAATTGGSTRPGPQDHTRVAVGPHKQPAEPGAGGGLKAGHSALGAPLDLARSSPGGGLFARVLARAGLSLHARRAKAVLGQAAAAAATHTHSAAVDTTAAAGTTTTTAATVVALQRRALFRAVRWVKVRGKATEPGVGDDLAWEPQPCGFSSHTVLEGLALGQGHDARLRLQCVPNQGEQERVRPLHTEHASLHTTDVAALGRMQEPLGHTAVRCVRVRAQAHINKAVKRPPPAGRACTHSHREAAQAHGGTLARPTAHAQGCVPRSCRSGSTSSARRTTALDAAGLALGSRHLRQVRRRRCETGRHRGPCAGAGGSSRRDRTRARHPRHTSQRAAGTRVRAPRRPTATSPDIAGGPAALCIRWQQPVALKLLTIASQAAGW